MEQTEPTKTTTTRLPDGEHWWVERHTSDDYVEHKYDIAAEPLLREIKHGDRVVGYVTRNRYNAEVLNTPSMMIVDIDVTDDHGRCANRELYQEMLVNRLPPEGIILNRIDNCITNHHLSAAIKRHVRKSSPLERNTLYRMDCLQEIIREQDEAVVAIVRKIERTRGLSWRTYRTRNGYRLIETSHEWAIPKQDNWHSLPLEIMRELFADEAYVRICGEQELYRARLTPKPWRETCHGYGVGCAARFMNTFGSGVIHPANAPLIEEHDRLALDNTGDDEMPLA